MSGSNRQIGEPTSVRPHSIPRRVVILGAAGRDFHNFNVVYRDDPDVRVVAFTATQIPAISDRRYPPTLAGPNYPDGIPIVDEAQLGTLLARGPIDEVVFAYSDVRHEHVMHLASIALSGGADFVLLGPQHTMLKSVRPVIAISAVRTGCGKSQTSRWLSRFLRSAGIRTAAIRHPMPYGNLSRQAVQVFGCLDDLDAAACTIEEREEYEPYLALGTTVYSGVDYAEILSAAERDADIILWDGGNNDFPFIAPDLHLVLVDPLRVGHGLSHHPGEAVLRMANVIIAAKCNAASDADIDAVLKNARAVNPNARLLRAYSPVSLDNPEAVRGKRAIVIEDGPTLTHGGMSYGAGYVAALAAGASEIVDPKDFAAPEIKRVYDAYPHIGRVLPAVGYHEAQLSALATTINQSRADVAVVATPCDIGKLINLNIPAVRAHYEFEDSEDAGLNGVINAFLAARGINGAPATMS